MNLYHIALLEKAGGGIARGIEDIKFRDSEGVLITCLDKITCLGRNYDFIAVSNEIAKCGKWDCGSISQCKILLVPGEYAVKAAEVINSGCFVSYGLSDRDSITLSSIEHGRAVLAIQRELVTLDQTVLDRQEVPVKFKRMSPETLMALAGSLLILGVPAGELSNHIAFFVRD